LINGRASLRVNRGLSLLRKMAVAGKREKIVRERIR